MSAVFPTAVSPTVTTVTSGALATLPLSLPAIQLPANSVNSPPGLSHFSVNSRPGCHQFSQQEGSTAASQAGEVSPSSPRGFTNYNRKITCLESQREKCKSVPSPSLPHSRRRLTVRRRAAPSCWWWDGQPQSSLLSLLLHLVSSPPCISHSSSTLRLVSSQSLCSSPLAP